MYMKKIIIYAFYFMSLMFAPFAYMYLDIIPNVYFYVHYRTLELSYNLSDRFKVEGPWK